MQLQIINVEIGFELLAGITRSDIVRPLTTVLSHIGIGRPGGFIAEFVGTSCLSKESSEEKDGKLHAFLMMISQGNA